MPVHENYAPQSFRDSQDKVAAGLLNDGFTRLQVMAYSSGDNLRCERIGAYLRSLGIEFRMLDMGRTYNDFFAKVPEGTDVDQLNKTLYRVREGEAVDDVKAKVSDKLLGEIE